MPVVVNAKVAYFVAYMAILVAVVVVWAAETRTQRNTEHIAQHVVANCKAISAMIDVTKVWVASSKSPASLAADKIYLVKLKSFKYDECGGSTK